MKANPADAGVKTGVGGGPQHVSGLSLASSLGLFQQLVKVQVLKAAGGRRIRLPVCV